MNIDINGIEITLTKEQLNQINNQLNNKNITINDLTSLDIAEKVLENTTFHNKCFQSDFHRTKDWLSYKLETIIKAANYIDNDYKEWIADFNNSNKYKYIPHFEKKSSGWVLHDVGYSYFSSICQVGFYYKKEETAIKLSKLYTKLYNQWIIG